VEPQGSLKTIPKLVVKGKAFFFSASIATYNSNLQWYIGNAVANGRVLSNGRRVSDQVVDGSILHLHAATCISERSEVQLVLIVDAITSRADVPGPSKTMPVKQLLLSQQIMQDSPGVPVVDISPRVQNMPPMLQSDGESMRLILEADSIAQLLMMRCERQAVSRGRECAMTTKNAALDLLLHELGKINCRYPGMVIDYIIAHYKERGIPYEDLSFRFHFNFHMGLDSPESNLESSVETMPGDATGVDIEDQDLPALIQAEVQTAPTPGPIETHDHQLHFDGSQSDSDTLELQMERGVATMTIRASRKEIEAFQNRIRRLKEQVPRKTDDPSFDFEGTVGASLYLPHLYISPPRLSSIARWLHDHYRTVLELAGFC
jgi:hypothetical protein